jgi:hypothetical protein
VFPRFVVFVDTICAGYLSLSVRIGILIGSVFACGGVACAQWERTALNVLWITMDAAYIICHGCVFFTFGSGYLY